MLNTALLIFLLIYQAKRTDFAFFIFDEFDKKEEKEGLTSHEQRMFNRAGADAFWELIALAILVTLIIRLF